LCFGLLFDGVVWHTRLWVAHPDFVRLSMAVVLAFCSPASAGELERLVAALVTDSKAVATLVTKRIQTCVLF
jgi:hypothetical protein